MLYEMKAAPRQIRSKALGASRREGLVPGIVYGPGTPDGVMVFVNATEFGKIHDKAGASAIVNLTVEGESKPRGTIIKDIDFDPVKGFVRHVDFYQFKEGQKLELETELYFIGEAPAVKTLGAILIKNFTSLNIRCLPTDIISSFDVDISILNNFGDKIRIKDLNIPPQIEVLHDPEAVVIIVTEPEEEEVVAAPTATVAAAPAAGEAGAAPAAGEAGAAPATDAKPAKKENKK